MLLAEFVISNEIAFGGVGLLGAALGLVIGVVIGKSVARDEAIQAGVAQWHANDSGMCEFRYRRDLTKKSWSPPPPEAGSFPA